MKPGEQNGPIPRRWVRPRAESPALAADDPLLFPLLYTDYVAKTSTSMPLLRCPRCGATSIYPTHVEFDPGDDYEPTEVFGVTVRATIKPLPPAYRLIDRRNKNRGPVLGLILWCEANHVVVVQFGIHKGRSYAETRSWDGPMPEISGG